MENFNRGKTIGNQTMSGKNAIMERNGKNRTRSRNDLEKRLWTLWTHFRDGLASQGKNEKFIGRKPAAIFFPPVGDHTRIQTAGSIQ